MTRKDGQFLFNTLVISLLLMAIMQAVAPLLEPADVRAKWMAETDARIVPLAANDVPYMLHSRDKKTLLFVYASWCRYCRQVMPQMMDLSEDGSLDKVRLLWISIDKDRTALARYLASYHRPLRFTPYQLAGGKTETLTDALMPLDSSYNGGIPYMALFDTEGRLVARLAGIVGRSDILTLVSQ